MSAELQPQYEEVSVSPWMEMDVCGECGFVDDAYYGRNMRVCPECGSTRITRRVGRWHTKHPRLTLWQSILIFIGILPAAAAFKLVPEFKS